MKINLKVAATTVVLLLMFACKKETNPFFATGTTPTLTSSATSITPAQSDSASTAVTFSWTNPNFATDSTNVQYVLEIDSTGKNFLNENVYTQTILTSRSVSLTAAQLNNILLNTLGFYYDSTYSIDVRVAASYANNDDQHFTNVLTLSVKPYRPLLPYTALWVAGDYEGWNPANASTLAYGTYSSLLNATAFDGYVNIPGGTDKILFTSSPDLSHVIYYDSAGTDFNYTAYGLGGGGDLSTSSGDTLALPFSGYFEINVDTVGNAWYYIPINSWGVIGSFAASGWSTDIPMTYNSTTGLWSATVTLAAGDQFKFRANASWSAPNPNFGTPGTGNSLAYGSGNINSPGAGTYTIILDLRVPGNYAYDIR